MESALVRIRPRGLEAVRLYAGLSRERLVRMLPEPFRITAQQLYRIEKGRSETTIAQATAIAEALSRAIRESVTLDDLFPIETSAGYDAAVRHTPGYRKAAGQRRYPQLHLTVLRRVS